MSDLNERLERIALFCSTLQDFISGKTLLQARTLDGELFVGPTHEYIVGRGRIVWWISKPTGTERFADLFCASAGKNPKADADHASDPERIGMMRKLRDSALVKGLSPTFRSREILTEEIGHLLGHTGSKLLPLCILVSYKVSPFSEITLFIHHPSIPTDLALELHMETFTT